MADFDLVSPDPSQAAGSPAAPRVLDDEERTRQWLPIVGSTPPFTRRQRRVFWISTSAGFFNEYDTALLTLALKQIQSGLGIAERALGTTVSFIRLGYLGSLLLTPFADVFGRRRLLLYTIIGYTVFTGLTALAPTAPWFVACQFFARALAGAEGAVALVIVIEEVDAAYRGWSIGLLGALAASGYGMAALAFATVNVIPYGWRGLYGLALVPLVLIIPLRRVLPESRRFERQKMVVSGPLTVLRPLIALVRDNPRRLAILLALIFVLTTGGAAAGLYFSKFLQEAHHYRPGNVATLYILGGGLGILGNVFSGRISDRLGRKRLGATFMGLATLLRIVVYSAPGWVVIPAWILCLFFETAGITILNAYSVELFPTSYRSTAASVQGVAGTAGGVFGLLIETLLFDVTGSHWSAVRYMLLLQFMVPVLIVLCLPETAGRELEEISPEHS